MQTAGWARQLVGMIAEKLNTYKCSFWSYKVNIKAKSVNFEAIIVNTFVDTGSPGRSATDTSGLCDRSRPGPGSHQQLCVVYKLMISVNRYHVKGILTSDLLK